VSVDPASGLPFLASPDPIDSVAHLIQTALTPVFMLSGIASLLMLFNTRLARVADHIEEVEHQLTAETNDDTRTEHLMRHQKRLHQRVFALDNAIILAGVGGAATCGAALALFLGSLRNTQTASWLIFLFGAALVCTVGGLTAFLIDTLLSWHGLRTDGALPRSNASHR